MFDEFVSTAWREHGAEPEAVFARLTSDGIGLAESPNHLARLAGLVVHVGGSHLGRWHDGLEALGALQASRAYDDSISRLIRRNQAILLWCAGEQEAAEARIEEATSPELPAESVRGRVLSEVAACWAGVGRTTEAGVVYDEALAVAASYTPAEGDPIARSLAITSNNLASALEEETDRDDAGTVLMKRAAFAARDWWAKAGNWLNAMLAETRLTYTHLAAGEPAPALAHAQRGLKLADDNDAGPDDRIDPLVAIAASRVAAGDDEAVAAVAEARACLENTSDGMRGYYQAKLDALS